MIALLCRLVGMIAIVAATCLTVVTVAQAGMGQPDNYQLTLQTPASPVADSINWFYNYVTIIIAVITVFVLALMIYAILRFNERANPTPSKFTHNTTVEVVWTVVPIMILIAIGIPSFKLLFLQYSYPKPDLVIKSTANAWFWDFEYPDQEISISQNIIRDEDVLRKAIGDEKFDSAYGDLEGLERHKALYRDAQQYWAKERAQRQLAVDNPIAVPLNKVVHVLVTSNDVIHGFAVPSLGSRVQAVPGRISATWFKATKPGAFYGQCAVVCGQYHASMPIAIHAVEQDVYDRWLAAVKADEMEQAKKILFDALPTGDGQKVALNVPANDN